MNRLRVTLSVDDGHPLDLRTAELLARHGLRATFYLPLANREGPPVLAHAQMRALAQDFEIGSHTLSHRFLAGLDERSAWREISDGKRALEDCIEQAARSNTYGRAADGDTEMVRFNCTGQPAQAFWTALDAWSLEQDSRWERDGWSYRSTTRVEQNLFGLDFCASDGVGYQCVIHLNVGEFATPR